MADIETSEGQMNGGGTLTVSSSEPVASKRQRRPSVRLGDIGDQPYDSHVRRSNKPWKLGPDHRKDYSTSGKASKTRTLLNLSSGHSIGAEFIETLEGDIGEGNLDSVAIGSWKAKESKVRGSTATKRVRSNWVSRIDEGGGGGEGEENYSAGEAMDDGYPDFDLENLEQSPVNSAENLAADANGNDTGLQYHGNRRSIRARVSEVRDHHDGIELSGPSDTDARDWKCGTSDDGNGNGGRGRPGEDGVRIWLNGLGLGRYAPVFEIHEVDDEILPLLTLEDLKDMGINAVGSRRKLYCAIQKLGQGFS